MPHVPQATVVVQVLPDVSVYVPAHGAPLAGVHVLPPGGCSVILLNLLPLFAVVETNLINGSPLFVPNV